MSSSVEAPVAIKFDHVTKTYKLYENDRQRFFSIFSSRDKRKLITKVNASNDLSFEIRKGEAVAFLGHNGAGKSTALKMITGVTFPTKGEVIVNGTVSALLELTAGFDMALTGRENIHLRGHAMGLDADEIAALEPKVVEFADLGVYIDQPVRTYSSGMKSRLASLSPCPVIRRSSWWMRRCRWGTSSSSRSASPACARLWKTRT